MAPYCSSPIPHKDPKRITKTLMQRIFGLAHVPHLGNLTTSIAGNTDASVVERSWGLLSQLKGREDQFYGPNFRWRELSKTRNWLHGVVLHWGLMIGGILLAILPPLRTLLRRFVTPPGQGPTPEAMAKERIEYRGVARPDGDQYPGKQAYSRAFWNGGMYDGESITVTEHCSDKKLTASQSDCRLLITGGTHAIEGY